MKKYYDLSLSLFRIQQKNYNNNNIVHSGWHAITHVVCYIKREKVEVGITVI